MPLAPIAREVLLRCKRSIHSAVAARGGKPTFPYSSACWNARTYQRRSRVRALFEVVRVEALRFEEQGWNFLILYRATPQFSAGGPQGPALSRAAVIRR